MTCRIRLCGPPSITTDEEVVANLRHKSIALIAYLAAEARAKSRDTLATLLWPDSGQAAARGNLRTAVHEAAHALPAGMVDARIDTIELLPCPAAWVDLWQLRQTVEALGDNGTAVERLAEASTLFRGEFLEGFSLPDCSDFDLWQLQTAERLRHQHILVLSRLVAARLNAGAVSEAVDDVVRLIALDPLEEASHRLAIEVYARCGRWAMALEQFDECRRVLREELDAEPGPETTKLAEEVRRRASRLFRPGVPPTSTGRGQIRPPVPATRFFGRERELDLIEGLLRHGERLVTVVGPAGVGKTRLALEAAAANAVSFPDGIVFGELTATRTPEDVPRILEAAVGIQQRSARKGETVNVIAEHLTGRRMLVLLDNFEHVIQAAPDLARVIAQSQLVQFLATSREPLRLSGEAVVRVAPLEVPGNGAESEISQNPAVLLFIDRAQSQFPELEGELSDLECVRSVCAALDGLPLAIELAVPLLHVYTLRELPARVSRPLGALPRGGRDVPERHRSLEQAIEWSCSLLEPAEKQALGRLSVLDNGFDMAAAVSVCANGDARSFRSSFAGLLEKSLVQVSTENPVRRFSLLESTREYVTARLRKEEELPGLRRRHSEHYGNLALQGEAALHGPQQMAWLETLDAEHPNLLEALEFLYANGRYVRGLETAAALEWYWYRRGQYRLGIEQIQRFLEQTPDLVAPVRARALHSLGWFTFLVGDWRAGHYLYAQSLHLSRKVGDPLCEQFALSDLGVAERWLGDIENGTRRARDAIDVARANGNPYSLARALVWAYATTGGHFADAYPVPELQEALAIAGRIGDLWLVAHSHNGLGDLYCAHGHVDEARAHYELALSGFLDLGDRYLAAWTLEGMGRVEAACGGVKAALARTFDALRLFDSLGDDLNVALMLARVVGLLGGLAGDRERAALAGASAGLVNAHCGEDLAHTPQVDEAVGYLAGLDTSHPIEWSGGRALARATAVARAEEIIQSV